jgi:hypothetical protein
MGNDINKLLEDKEFVEKILIMPTLEEIQKAFLDRGVEISIKELEEIAKNISKLVSESKQNEKIADSKMENISGGINVHEIVRTAVLVIMCGSTVHIANKASGVFDSANLVLRNTNQAVVHANQTLGRADQTLDCANQAIGNATHVISHADQTLDRADQIVGHADQIVGHADQTLSYADQAINSVNQAVARVQAGMFGRLLFGGRPN